MSEQLTEREYTDLLYEPPPFVAQSFWDEFNKIVPDAPCGNGVKMLRWEWGCDRLEYCAGHWERRYGDTDNEPAKYVGRTRWILEGWQSPDVYDVVEWKKDEHLLGDFPRNGVFDFLAFHTDNQGGYLPLDESALNHARIWAHWQGQGKKRSVEELLAAKHALWHQRYVEREKAKEKVALAFGERVVKHLENDTNPVSTVGANPLTLPPGFTKTSSGIIVPNN